MIVECPQCHSPQRQTKAGRTRAGSQRYFCAISAPPVARPIPQYPVPKLQDHVPAVRQQAVTMCLEGVSRNKVARLLQVAPQSVSNWCQVAQERLVASGQTPLPAEAALSCAIVEMDELHTFVGAKRGLKRVPLPCNLCGSCHRLYCELGLGNRAHLRELQPLADQVWQHSLLPPATSTLTTAAPRVQRSTGHLQHAVIPTRSASSAAY